MPEIKESFQNVVTGVLVVCAIAVTLTVLRGRRYPPERQAIAKHIPNWEQLTIDRAPVMGLPSAPVKIIEFSDYECPYCHGLETNLQALIAIYGDRVAIIRYDLPLSVHSHAHAAAIAAACAARQGVYEPYQAELFDKGAHLENVNWTEIARATNVTDLRSFSECVRLELTTDVVRADEAVGNRLGIQATPTLIINGDLLEGSQSLQTLSRLVAQAMGSKQPGIWARLTHWLS